MTPDSKTPTLWKMSMPWWVLLGIVIALIGIAFYDTISDMVYRWNSQEEYGYGYIIPVIALYFIWQRKNLLAETEFTPSLAGLALTLLGGMLLFLGSVATTHTLSQYGLVVTIMGVTLALAGRRAFGIVLVPLALLFFMVPLPPFIYNTLSTKLQLISSQLGVAVIRMFDISVYLEGNVIDLGTYQLQVVDACSGLRYLFPLASLAFIAAFIFRGAFWKKAVIFLSSMPITVFMNSLRIGIIGVLVEYGGKEQAQGFLHYFEGWVIFMACMAILIAEMTVLARIGREKLPLSEVFAIDPPPRLPADIRLVPRRLESLAWITPALLVIFASSSFYVQGRENIIPERQTFAGFPLHVDGWEGEKQELEAIILDSLKTEDYILADYNRGARDMVNFYVAYYADQGAGSAAHSPRSCIPGGGWLIKELQVVPVPGVQMNGMQLMANRLLIKKGDHVQVVYYWFQQRGRDLTNEWLVKWFLFWDAMTQNRTDGALVRLTSLLFPGEVISDVDNRIVEFAGSIAPFLDDYIPGRE